MPEFVVEFRKDGAPPDDGRLDAVAFHRNHAAIAPVLEAFLGGRSGDVLEIGAGTGQHAVAFAQRLPSVTWWPTDFNDNHLHSIAAWRKHAQLETVQAPARLDASAPDWRLSALGLPSAFTAIFCANVIHISPWAVAEGLFAGAARHLAAGGRLFLYGPFVEADVPTAPSNLAFDESLKSRDPAWGLRRLDDVVALAARHGLSLAERIAMPANNLTLVFAKA